MPKEVEMFGGRITKIKRETGYFRINSTLHGNEQVAHSIFEKLIGNKILKNLSSNNIYQVAFPDGSYIQYRSLSRSGHLKIEIYDALQKIYEKITIINPSGR